MIWGDLCEAAQKMVLCDEEQKCPKIVVVNHYRIQYLTLAPIIFHRLRFDSGGFR